MGYISGKTEHISVCFFKESVKRLFSAGKLFLLMVIKAFYIILKFSTCNIFMYYNIPTRPTLCRFQSWQESDYSWSVFVNSGFCSLHVLGRYEYSVQLFLYNWPFYNFTLVQWELVYRFIDGWLRHWMNGILYNDCIVGWRLLATLSAESNRLTHMSNQISIYITLMIIEEIYYRVTQEL
jgi:hypothetical protein